MSRPILIHKHQCFECGGPPEHWHHVIPASCGGSRTLPLCKGCHALAHNSEFVLHGNVCWEATEYGRANIAHLINAYVKGATIRELSEAYDISQATCRHVLIRQGVFDADRDRLKLQERTKVRNASQRKFTDEQEAQIAEQYLMGKDILDLQDLWSASNTTIYKVLKRRGVTLRKTPRPPKQSKDIRSTVERDWNGHRWKWSKP